MQIFDNITQATVMIKIKVLITVAPMKMTNARYIRVVYSIVTYRISGHCITGPKSLQLFCSNFNLP